MGHTVNKTQNIQRKHFEIITDVSGIFVDIIPVGDVSTIPNKKPAVMVSHNEMGNSVIVFCAYILPWFVSG